MKLATGRLARRRAIGLLFPLALGLLAAWSYPRFDAYDRSTWDLRFNQRGAVAVPDNVAVVDINDDTVTYAPWAGEPMVMWGKHYAQALRHLADAGAQVIGIDMLQHTSTQELADRLNTSPWDQEFALALAEVQRTVLIVIRTAKGWERPTDQIFYANGEENIGAANFLEGREADPDGIVRAIKPCWEGKTVVPSFALRLVERYTGQKARLASGRRIEVGDLHIPLHRDGTMLINYAGPPRTLPYFAFHDIAEGRMPRDFDFHGKVVLIGASAASLQDLHLTPFTRGAEADGQHMPGVEVWANAVSTILNHRFLSTTEIPVGRLLIVALALVTGAVFLSTHFALGAAVCIATVVGWYATGCWLFTHHDYLLLTFVPICLVPANYTVVMGYRFFTEEREKRQIKGLWSRYQNPTIMQYLLEHPEEQGLGGKRATVTVLFSDIRGFTSMSDRMEPADVVRILNEYLSEMSAIVVAHGGIVDKYVGDAVMAVWGVPFGSPDGPIQAVRAGIRMHQALDELNARWARERLAVRATANSGVGESAPADQPICLKIGVGINTGEAVFGNIGSELKMDITVIGDTVNVASRLESLTKEYGERVVIGETVRESVRDLFATHLLPGASVRGKGSMAVYGVDVTVPEGACQPQASPEPGAEAPAR